MLKGSLSPQHVLSSTSLFQQSPFNKAHSTISIPTVPTVSVPTTIYNALSLRTLTSAILITCEKHGLLDNLNKKALKKLSVEWSIGSDTEIPNRTRPAYSPLLETIKARTF